MCMKSEIILYRLTSDIISKHRIKVFCTNCDKGVENTIK